MDTTGRLSWRSSARTDAGRLREANEDAYLERADAGLWVVADGMGGHAAGELASRAVVDELADLDLSERLSDSVTQIEDRLIRTNAHLRELAASRDMHTVGSTVVALRLLGRHGACIWAGDSRAYRYRRGRLECLTDDHTLVSEFLERGIIDADQADGHPHGNLVTRAVGAADALHPDLEIFELEPRDVFVLCSDGLTKEVGPQELARILGKKRAADLGYLLVELALANGGRDNVTVIAIGVDPSGEVPSGYDAQTTLAADARYMKPSQLRRLAKDRARGHLALDEYRKRRRALIDGIVEGAVAIERGDTGARGESGRRAHRPRPGSPARRLRPSNSVIGGSIFAALLAWALWSALRPSPPASESALPRIDVPMRQVSTARGLVETFLAARSWDRERIEAFERQWDALDSHERTQARAAPWFARLVAAVNDQIEALTTLDSSPVGQVDSATVERLRTLVTHLGISERPLPGGPVTRESAPPSTPAQSPMRPVPRTGDAPPTAGPPPGEASRPSARDSSARTFPHETSSRWLARQPDDAFTLVLLAASHLDQVLGLITRYPSLPAQVLDYRSDAPRFRVVYGSFASGDEARAELERLPRALRGARMKRFVELKSQWHAARNRKATRNPTASDPLAAQDPTGYTVQLFASDSHESARRLVANHPNLDLTVHTTRTTETRYRVLYGSFPSEQEARAAGRRLPAAVLSDTGPPVIRRIADLRAPRAANGD